MRPVEGLVANGWAKSTGVGLDHGREWTAWGCWSLHWENKHLGAHVVEDWAAHLAEVESGKLSFGKRYSDRPKPNPHNVKGPVRARFFCSEHGEDDWALVAVVTDRSGTRWDDRIVTYEEFTGYPNTTRDVRASCPRHGCVTWVIEYDALRRALAAPRKGRVLKASVAGVARRAGGARLA